MIVLPSLNALTYQCIRGFHDSSPHPEKANSEVSIRQTIIEEVSYLIIVDITFCFLPLVIKRCCISHSVGKKYSIKFVW